MEQLSTRHTSWERERNSEGRVAGYQASRPCSIRMVGATLRVRLCLSFAPPEFADFSLVAAR